jgi:thiol-disulfide isomerase/thioredoxin
MKFMKRLLFIIAMIFSAATLFAQNLEITVESDGTKVLKGFVSKQLLTSDPSFAWFAENQKSYRPNAAALQALKDNKDALRFLVFGGTWCGDTKFVLPKFYSLVDAAGVAPDHITLLGVDRSKKTIQNLSEAFNVTNVPTIIVLKDGKEIGRVIEYGTSGMFDKDLGEIISRIK